MEEASASCPTPAVTGPPIAPDHLRQVAQGNPSGSAGSSAESETSIPDFKLDPLFNTTWKLKLHQVLDFPEHSLEKNHLCFQNHVFHKIEVCGQVISIDSGVHGTQFEIDDGTAVLPCMIWSQLGNIVEFPSFTIGCCVTAEGKLNTGYGMRQLIIKRIEINRNQNARTAFASQAEKLMRDVYTRPWVPPTSMSSEHSRIKDEIHGKRIEKRQKAGEIFDYLQSKYMLDSEFSLEALQQDPALKKLTHSWSTESCSIKLILEELVTLGMIYKKGTISAVYGFVPHDQLQQHILEALRHPAHQLGAKADDIWQRIRWDHPEFADIPKQQVSDVLVELDEAGLIYECYHRMFKLSS
ncbi:hypothetical protein DSO57_1037750 [Entomophthora muscae]|uniref:Uncharacterized protein n=1 Tax=Entomophthora muscae TaxID=34485 RepID=A0ACC2U8H7_9FUNG|nr:hypothetical protein DSO57_1037750 [Entomophthora muscae]